MCKLYNKQSYMEVEFNFLQTQSAILLLFKSPVFPLQISFVGVFLNLIVTVDKVAFEGNVTTTDFPSPSFHPKAVHYPSLFTPGGIKTGLQNSYSKRDPRNRQLATLSCIKCSLSQRSNRSKDLKKSTTCTRDFILKSKQTIQEKPFFLVF